ncbi:MULTISPECIES: hypothetical protein [Bacillus]|uniref:Uncharacterized protein n=2 Tax=Bacillus thuringiensis TaxID=1428 RepID=A0AAP4Q6U6_BACTU|nr:MULTISPECIES: hypothetical protein [Bacillus]MEC0046360.1 hypothetical protein [Bacillus cereus]AFV21724.1 hypothetical protein BTB_502p04190 [Bacillus thuringiensis Bt407]EEM25247.1 hypothetical protein bthur0002_58890 [Bacillus thuringiensis Bt407]ERI01100.1 hypothetical protein BTCBT_002655 [Bacillus thuringiensis T01-328]MBN6707855.1 hypothetical protein [Bacillus thuringiensis]
MKLRPSILIEMANRYDSLSDVERGYLNHAINIYKPLLKIEKSPNKNELLEDEYYNLRTLNIQSVENYLLQELLWKFLKRKGLSKSMLSMEELLSMVFKEYEHTRDLKSEKLESIEGIQKLLQELEEQKNKNIETNREACES